MKDDRQIDDRHRPLLFKFMRAQPLDDMNYRYDPALSLNVSIEDGAPLVASAHGRSRLKTVTVRGED